MQIGIRPLLMSSRLTDTEQKIMWGDEHWARLSGSGATAEVVDDNLYLAMSVRNSGSGIAVIHGWHLVLQELQQDHAHAEPDEFRRQLRDPYVAGDDVGFWAGRHPRSGRSRIRRPAGGPSGPPRLRDRAALQRSRGRSARDRTVRGRSRQGVGLALLGGPALEPGSPGPALRIDLAPADTGGTDDVESRCPIRSSG